MKKYFITFISFIAISLNAQQAFKGINYQAVIRNADMTVLTNTTVDISFQVYDSFTSSTAVYTETHTAVSTGSSGVVSRKIGGSSNNNGSALAAVDWQGEDACYEVYVNFGLGWQQMGTRTGFASVPYALYAKSAPSPAVSYNNGTLSVGGNSVTIPSGNNYVQGNGISINSNTITNSLPDVPVTITGSNGITVNSSYPNFTISTLSSTTSQVPNFIINAPHTVNSSTSTNTHSFVINDPALSINGSTLSVGTNTVNLNAWSLQGNSNTTPGVDYLGTSDNQSLVFKTNNIGRMAINSNTVVNSGGVVIGGNVSSTSLGRALTLQGLLNPADASDQTYGHFAIRSNTIGSAAPQAFLSFANNFGARLGYMGIFSTSNNDLYVHGESNLRLGAGAFSITPAIFVQAVNNQVGINKINPKEKLDINGNVLIDSSLFLRKINAPPLSPPGLGKIYFDAANNKFMVSENGGPFVKLTNGSPWVQGVGAVFLDNLNDKVGLGTNNPNYEIDVQSSGASASLRLKHSGSAIGLVIQENNLAANILNYQATPIRFGTQGADRMILSKDGELVIGAPFNPNALLDINGSFKLGPNGTVLQNMVVGTATLNIGPVGIAVHPFSITAPGAQIGDRVIVSLEDNNNPLQPVIITQARVSSANTISGNYYAPIIISGISSIRINYMVIKL